MGAQCYWLFMCVCQAEILGGLLQRHLRVFLYLRRLVGFLCGLEDHHYYYLSLFLEMTISRFLLAETSLSNRFLEWTIQTMRDDSTWYFLRWMLYFSQNLTWKE